MNPHPGRVAKVTSEKETHAIVPFYLQVNSLSIDCLDQNF